MAGSPIDPGPERKYAGTMPQYGKRAAITKPPSMVIECVNCGRWPALRSVIVAGPEDPKGQRQRFCEDCYHDLLERPDGAV